MIQHNEDQGDKLGKLWVSGWGFLLFEHVGLGPDSLRSNSVDREGVTVTEIFDVDADGLLLVFHILPENFRSRFLFFKQAK